MVQTIDWYKGLWDEMICNDKPRNSHFDEVDEAVEFGFELPAQLKELKWMRNIQSTLPIQVITVGTKTLATIEPTVFIQPQNSNEATAKVANTKEQNVLWQLRQMEKRTRYGFISDVVESALRYGVVASFTVPIDWQVKAQRGVLPSRYDAAFNQGGYISIVEDPKTVHARFSPLGLDKVLVSKVMRASDAVQFYGKEATSRLVEEMDAEEMFVSVYDYWDYESRITWLSHPSEYQELSTPTKGWIIDKGEMELPFLPWTIVESGTSFGTTEDHKLRSILSPVIHSNQLELSNLVQSMAFAEATAYAAAPRAKTTSHSGETITIDYGEINQQVVLKPGEDFEILSPPTIDGNLLVIFDRIEAAFSKLTGLRALADLDSPSGTAYATVNAQIKQATTALDPSKRLAERALSGIAETILRWSAHTGDDLTGYGAQDGNMGEELRTKSTYIDPKEIYVEVKLSHHIPTDELQQINAVTILMKEVGISFVDAAKKLDIPNPEELLDRYEQEQLDKAQLAIAIKKMNADADLEIEAKRMQLQMGMQQQMEQAQQQQQGGLNAESESQARMAQGGFSPHRTGAPRREAQSIAARGPGYNPARGGLSPNEANPDFTKEGMTGVDRSGEVI